MDTINEDKKCYASEMQREILAQLITNPTIEETFFLTGGTALSVFYLHHRLSEDLDFFTKKPLDLNEIGFWIVSKWQKDIAKIKEGPQFLSLLIKGVKVDFVVDALSIDEERTKIEFENKKLLLIDTINNIVSNKFCTIVSRIEPKDFIDFYFILKNFPELEIKNIYQKSKLKDAIFDDPPTVAFQLESGINFWKENPSLTPKMLKDFNHIDLFNFYDDLTKWMYNLIHK